MIDKFEKDEFEAQMGEMIQYLIKVYEEMIANEEDEIRNLEAEIDTLNFISKI